MKFLFMIFHDEGTLDALPRKRCRPLSTQPSTTPRRSGRAATTSSRMRCSAPGAPGPSGLRRQGDHHDGPFAETKELLAGSSSSKPRTWTRRARWPRGSPGPNRYHRGRPVQELKHS